MSNNGSIASVKKKEYRWRNRKTVIFVYVNGLLRSDAILN